MNMIWQTWRRIVHYKYILIKRPWALQKTLFKKIDETPYTDLFWPYSGQKGLDNLAHNTNFPHTHLEVPTLCQVQFKGTILKTFWENVKKFSKNSKKFLTLTDSL